MARGGHFTWRLTADIFQTRGDLGEALRIHRSEVLPVLERLGDVRGRAITMGRIASILAARGDLDEAQRILRADVFPVLDRLGDMLGKGLMMGQSADILQARGDLDAALRIRREHELPICERLGGMYLIVSLANIGSLLLQRQQQGDAEDARRHLARASAIAAAMRIPFPAWARDWLESDAGQEKLVPTGE